MKLIISCIICLVPLFVDAQNISTFAGDGSAGDSGNGGLATTAKITRPVGGTFDKYGNYYSVVVGAAKVIKVDALGIISTVAGTGSDGYNGDGIPATAAQLKTPQAVAFDGTGNMYIADAGNHRIRKVDKLTGIISTVVGTGAGSYGGDNGPATAAQILSPLDLCFDKMDNMYIADNANGRVRKVTPSGIISTFAGTGTIYSSPGGGRADTTPIVGASGVFVDRDNNVYIADLQSRVYKVSTSGIITTVAGNGISGSEGDGKMAINTKIIPAKVLKDKYSNVYIAEYDLHNVRMVDKYGYIHTIVGNGAPGYNGDNIPASTALVNFPAGLALDTCENLYVADARNHRIRKITYPKCHYLETETLPQVSSQISIYPNPSNDILHIDNLQTTADYRLLSMVGAVLQQGGLKEGSNVIDITALPMGMYLVEVSNAAVGLRMMYKIVKQ